MATQTPAQVIQARYLALKQHGIDLGLAQAGVVLIPQGGYRIYAKGIIYAIGSSGRSVHGKYFPEYKSHQYHSGPLGFPSVDEPFPNLITEVFPEGDFRDFEKGGIYKASLTLYLAVHGDIYKKWASMGGITGKLGLPASKVLKFADGVSYQNFQKGQIILTPQNGAKGITEPFLTAWNTGGGSPTKGYPLTDVFKISGKPGEFCHFPKISYAKYTGQDLIFQSAGFLESWTQRGTEGSPAGILVSGMIRSPWTLRTHFQEYENQVWIIENSANISVPPTLAVRRTFALNTPLPLQQDSFLTLLNRTLRTRVAASPSIQDIPGDFKLGNGTVVKVVPYMDSPEGLIRRCIQVKFNFEIEEGIISLASGSFTLDLEPILRIPSPNLSSNTPPDVLTLSAQLFIRPIRFTSSISLSLLGNCGMTPSTARTKLKNALLAQTGPTQFIQVATLPGLTMPLSVRFNPESQLEFWIQSGGILPAG